ncbi:MAG TPA: tRNA lysidine(34) synthetase TilS [Flavobacteriaceae bacterium]|nr:tRNA lysidine(34) synthetase TilS [Flavobacteriaceae bacterium]
MLTRFKNYLSDLLPSPAEKKFLIACSGGVDSMVLVHLMDRLEYKIALVHCNFQLRGKESDRDEMFVVGTANKMGIPVYSDTFETEKFAKKHRMSVQLAARNLRYTRFSELLEKFDYDYLVTAHHLDDDLETFLINLSRGTGLKGLTGIPKKNNKIIRPLLQFSKEEIISYARKENILWREDSSNDTDDYVRNNLRHHVIPSLKESNIGFLKNYATTRSHLQAAQRLLEDYATLVQRLVIEEKDDSLHFDLIKLQGLPNYKDLLFLLLSDFGFTSWPDIQKLVSAETGKRVFSSSHRLLKNRGTLILSQITTSSDFSYEVSKDGIKTPINLTITEVDFIDDAGADIIFADEEKLHFPLVLRRWQEGDVFYPFGMQGKKKLSKFFKDEKYSQLDKERQWLLCNGNDILWVVGKRMDERFKITEETRTILKIALES